MTQRTFDAVRENLDQVLTFLDSQLENWDCPMRVQMQLDVAVEELFVNIASYAYVDKTGIADITIELLPGQVVQITFRDSLQPVRETRSRYNKTGRRTGDRRSWHLYRKEKHG